jgi:RecB family exonuclease/inactivated superfamily I helicase
VITPRQTRLLRVPDLHAFRRALGECAYRGADVASHPNGGVLRVRDTAVLVPTAAAARQLRRTLENALLTGASRTMVLPAIVTRAGLYDELVARLASPRAPLSSFEREAIFRACAREAVEAGAVPPFTLRPGLVGEMLALYDALHRNQRTLKRFEELMVEELETSADTDRGAERLLRQTRFLVAAFTAYERRLDAGDLLDERRLRARLLEEPARRPLKRLVIAVGDRTSDADGLWPADFDLVARVPGVEEIDFVATDAVLDAGLHERLQELLPGFDEVRSGVAAPLPTLVAPPSDPTPAVGAATVALAFVFRDREEEVADAARAAKVAAIEGHDTRAERRAIVCQRPLPYLYLAQRLFESAGVPHEALDTVPLAAEPYAAALDLMFSFVHAGYTRRTLTAMLRAPQFHFEVDGDALQAPQVASVDRALLDARYIGSLPALQALIETRVGRTAGAALQVAIAIAAELDPLQQAMPASRQLDVVLAFLRAHEAPPPSDEPIRARHLRARAAVLGAVTAVRDAHITHDDPVLPFVEVAAIVRRWLEAQTFAPEVGRGGVQLADATSARFGDFDSVRLVGLVEGEWPEAERRSIFYPAALLTSLGWPKETDRLRAARAAFRDLIHLPQRELLVSTFTLEHDAIVAPSAFLEEVADAGFPVRIAEPSACRVFAHEALMLQPTAGAVGDIAAAWLALRSRRTPSDSDRFRGRTEPYAPPVYSVSAIDRYLDCPFKYFARDVLQLPELDEEKPTLTPLARGRFIHDVFQRFFDDWQRGGHGAITPDSVDAALTRFAEILEPALEALPEADRALERTRMLGSAAAPGLGDRVLRLEAEKPLEIVERLLECDLSGTVTISDGDRARQLPIRGIADRIDLLGDGTLRLIDYKTGSGSKARRSVQLPVYAASAEQRLEGHRGRVWRVGEAGYIPLKGPMPFMSLETNTSTLKEALQAGQGRCLDALEGIGRGEFPVQPTDEFLCNFCAYAAVCRKDYVGDA